MQKIEVEDARLIKSQQYIHSSYLIVKELVENSLDAKATIIKVIIDDTLISVEDNGEGIEDLKSVCKHGHTSKEDTTYKILGIKNDLEFSHGFRGQALSSIKDQCDIEIVSRTRENDRAFSMNYSTGILVACARNVGTTVKVYNLFKNSPIRKTINQKDAKKSVAKMLHLLNSFIYVYEVCFTLAHKGKVLFCEQGSKNTKNFAISRFGDPCFEIQDESFEFYLFPFDKSKLKVIMFYKRLCSYEKASQIIEKTFKMYHDYSPSYILLLKSEGDVNVSIDKTEVILRSSKHIESKIKSELDKYFAAEQTFEGNEKKIKVATPNQLASSCSSNNNLNPRTSSNVYSRASEENCGWSLNKSEINCESHSDEKEKSHVFLEAISGSAYSCIKEEFLRHKELTIEKDDFSRMNIIGQFNQGFILCSLRKDKRELLMVVDQHAADEIYNFESLNNNFLLKRQKLLDPITLNLNPIQEIAVEENMAAFNKNGFEIKDGKLLTIPVYQNNFFGVEDFFSLLENLEKGLDSPSKFRNIMASKACRSSIMVGETLNYKEMKKVLTNLSTLKLPWCCPHGRPTFKILSELSLQHL